MDATKKSPVVISLRKNRITVERRDTGDVLAHCMIGDDENVERIADILSAKRLPEDAMKLRQMAKDARRARC
jgi:hypothetical protein